MQRGTVKFYHETKGYGFIKQDEDTENLFFHFSGLKDPLDVEKLATGVRVRYELAASAKGPCGVNVELLD
jgi:CspA family cold shock protein